jgi:DNA-binding NtrC family response regulator
MMSTTLLVTQNPSVVNDLQVLHDETDFARLEVCGRFEKVPPRLGSATALLILDSPPSVDEDRIRGLLGAAERSLVRAVVVWRADANAAPPEYAPFPVYQLPDDLPALRELLQTTHAELARSQPAAAQPHDAFDPITATLLGSDLTDQLDRIRRVAGQPTTILLTGETGSGKNMMAKFIHSASPRRGEPYLVVDCGALTGQLIESEMYGHVRGAFTGADRDRQGKFAAAGVGTLVLDEINSLPLPLQAKLLRAVEERVFEPVGSNKTERLRARLIAVSNVPLEDEVRRERFRSDLFYRLNVVEFRIPPLRERPGAVIPLAHQLLRTSATAACQGVTAISPGALEAMANYQWPGNVRELRNVIEGAAALAHGPVIQSADLPESIRRWAGSALRPVAIVPGAPHDGGKAASDDRPFNALPVPPAADTGAVSDASTGAIGGVDEGARILAVLRKHNNNRRRAAAELGMSRVSLYKKLHKAGLFVPKQQRVAAVASAV